MRNTYMQVGLAQENQRTIGWIEARGAKVGARVELLDGTGFWTVTGVGTTELSKDEMREREARSRQTFTAQKSYRKGDE